MDKADILAGVRALRERILRAVNVTAVSEDKDLLLAMADVVEEALEKEDGSAE